MFTHAFPAAFHNCRRVEVYFVITFLGSIGWSTGSRFTFTVKWLLQTAHCNVWIEAAFCNKHRHAAARKRISSNCTEWQNYSNTSCSMQYEGSFEWDALPSDTSLVAARTIQTETVLCNNIFEQLVRSALAWLMKTFVILYRFVVRNHYSS